MRTLFNTLFVLTIFAVTLVNVVTAYSYIDGLAIATFYFLCAEFIFAVGLSVFYKIFIDKWQERKDKKLFAESFEM